MGEHLDRLARQAYSIMHGMGGASYLVLGIIVRYNTNQFKDLGSLKLTTINLFLTGTRTTDHTKPEFH